jgi:hypothetical protein
MMIQCMLHCLLKIGDEFRLNRLLFLKSYLVTEIRGGFSFRYKGTSLKSASFIGSYSMQNS